MDYLVHISLDMVGAWTFACIMGTCTNPKHNPGRVLSWIGKHPWYAQLASAVVIGVIAVNTIG